MVRIKGIDVRRKQGREAEHREQDPEMWTKQKEEGIEEELN